MKLPESLPTKWVIIGTVLGLIIIGGVTTTIVSLENSEHHGGRGDHMKERDGGRYAEQWRGKGDDRWGDDAEDDSMTSDPKDQGKKQNIPQKSVTAQTGAINNTGNILPSPNISSGSTQSGALGN